MRFAIPSRADAKDMTRNEKMALMFLANTASALAEARESLADRIACVEDGPERINRLAEESLNLLNDIRTTVPERQRVSMANTAKDYEIRLIPKFTPSTHNVVVQKEDFRKMIDAAQVKCRECVDDNEECRKCDLYQLLTVVLPLDRYDGTMMCPYALAEWEN